MNIEKLKKEIIKANSSILDMTAEQEAIQSIAEHCHSVDDRQGLDVCNQITEILENKIGRDIRLADIFLAFNKTKKMVYDLLTINDEGELRHIRGNNLVNMCFWNLEKDLDWHAKHKPETVKFLSKLLC